MPANRRLKRLRKIEDAKLAKKQRRQAAEKSEAFVEGLADSLKTAAAAAQKAVPPMHLLAKSMMYARQIGAALKRVRGEKAA